MKKKMNSRISKQKTSTYMGSLYSMRSGQEAEEDDEQQDQQAENLHRWDYYRE